MVYVPRFGEIPKKIFISSVFNEPSRKTKWSLRYSFYYLLLNRGYLPWLWEQAIGSVEKISDKLKSDLLLQGDVVKYILRDRISTCDAIVTFYKNRAGSTFPAYSKMAYDASFHEIELAAEYSIPIFLIVIGNTPTLHLRDTLAVIDQAEILGNRFHAKDDDEALNMAVYQLQQYFKSGKPVMHTGFNLNGVVKANDELDNAIISQDFNKGIEIAIANRHFANQNAVGKTQRYHHAKFFSKMGTVYANRRIFSDAIGYLNKSIHLYMTIGDEWSMTAEIQALSGVQNMANLFIGRNTNAFGFRATKVYRDLADGFRDTRISIYRNLGRFNEAWKLIDIKGYVHSPYRAAKMLSIYAGRRRFDALNFARKMMEFEVLPSAIKQESSLYYVYLEAGNLAMKQHDYVSAENYYDSALKFALSKGALHTAFHVQQNLLKVRSK